MSGSGHNPQTAETLRRAWDLHRSGRIAEAERLYRAVLAAYPAQPDALHFLGIAEAQQGRTEAGLALIERSLAVHPNQPGAHHNRGNMLRDLGRFEDAAASFTRALALRPDHADALAHRGACLFEMGRTAEALADFDRALALAPDRPAVHYNRANALRSLGREAEALAGYDRVLALKPDHADAHNNRGLVLFALARAADALASYDRAIAAEPHHADARLNRAEARLALARSEEALADYDALLARAPAHAGAHYGRANALMALRRAEEALASYDRALGFAPGDPAMLNNRGNALAALQRHEEALESFGRAIAADPRAREAFNNRGHVLAAMRDFEGALASYDQALALDPACAGALYGRAYALLELKRSGDAALALEQALRLDPGLPYGKGLLLHARRMGCDWRDDTALGAEVAAEVRAGKKAVTPLAFLAVSDSPEDNTRCARIAIADKYPQAQAPLWHGARRTSPRIRLAYLSADFNAHAVTTQAMGVFERHDRACFDIAALSYGPSDRSPLRARAMKAFSPFIDINNKSDQEAARLLRAMEIDIAIDLTGLTGVGRPGILAFRPAPLQVNYLGFPGSMGASYYDYLLADEIAIPEDAAAFYDENIVHLPGSFMPHDRTRAVAARPTRAQAGLPERGFVFASFNAAFKFSPAMFDIWMRLLAHVEGSVLWLPAGTEDMRRNLGREAQARGVAPERLIFAAYVPAPEDHLARLALADLFLDTAPYNAHSTACDALWAGLPVLTLAGRSFAARVAASLLHAAGLKDLVTETPEAYESLALTLARDTGLLGNLREKLARARAGAPLFDTARTTRNLEAAYRTMWARHQRGEPPMRFAVEEPQGRTP